MSNIAENIGNFGIWEGAKETIADLFGQGTKQTPAKFKVTDDNGDTSEVSNAAATPFYKTPTGYSNTRSYAYLTQGDNGKLTLNVSKDLYDSDTFKEQYLDNYTFKNVLKAYNANKNADTVITTTDADGNTENKTFRQVVDDYNKALSEFASSYEGYSLLRDDVRNNTGFELSDAEIRIASNSIGKDDKKSETSIIYLPDEWMNIYDFTKMGSFDKDTKTVSAKDFFDAYNLDKKGGINEEAWNEMVSSANSVVANAYSGSMKKNVDEDAGGDEEATAKAKDRLVRAYQASNLLSKHDPEQSFLHTAGIVASDAVLSFSDKVTNLLNNVGYLEAFSIEGYHAAVDYGVAFVKDALSFNVMLQGAASEDLEGGAVTPYNYNEYIDGILVASTDGSLSEIERVKAEWDAKVSSGNTLYQLAADKDFNKMLQFREAAEGQIDYTSRIAPAAARAGELMGEGIFIALEIYMANVSGQGVGTAVESAAAEGALATAFAKGTPLLTRLTSLANAALTNKFVSFNANITTQALIDTIAFEDTETLNAAMANMDPGAIATLNNAFADNFVGNTVAEVSGVFGSAVGDKINSSKNPVVRYVNSRAIKVANAISLPKKKAQMKFASTKLARFLSRPLGRGTTAAADFAVKAMTEMDGAVFKAGNLEEFNIEKARMEYEATKNVAKAKAGQQYVVNYETNATKMAATTTEAIFGKAGEKKNLLNQASRIAEGIKSYTQEMLADESIRTTWESLTNEANNLNNVLRWSEYNPAAGRFLSQDASNYVINKAHYDDLLEKQRLKLLKEETLSAAEAKKLNELKEWLHNFSMRYSTDAITALNKFIDSDRALNKALTDWQVRHGVMPKAQYESLAGVGYYGENDERYIRAIALPEGKTMDSVLSEEYETFAIGTDRQFLENVGRTTGVRDVNTIFDQDLHLSNKTDSNYLDPVLTNAMTISSIAKAYQGKMWGNALMSVKAVTNTVDMTGKPASKTEINSIIKKAGEAASTAISKASFDDLVPDDVESIGKAYVESRTDYTVESTDKKGKTTKENKNKVEEAQKAVNKKLGIADDAQVITRTNSLDVDQTKNVLATFGADAPTYGKVRTNAELKAQFDALSEKQQEQALEAMGSKAIKTTKTYKTEVPNPEHAEWVKEKKAFNDEQKALKEKFDEEQKALKAEYDVKKKAYDEYVEASKKTSAKDGGVSYSALEKDARDAILYEFNRDTKTGKTLSTDKVNEKISAERKKEISDILKDDFSLDDFEDLDAKLDTKVDSGEITKAEKQKQLVESAVKPEYLNKARGASSSAEGNVASVTGLKEKIVGEGKNSRKVKEVPIANGKYSIDYDASIADGIDGLINDKGFSIKEAESGIANDYPNKNRLLFGRGEGHIEFDDVNDLKKSQINKIKKSAEKADLEFKAEYWKSKFDGKEKLLSLKVTQDTTIDGTSATTVYKEAKKNAIKKFGGKASDVNDIFGFEKSLGDGKKIDDFRNFLNDEHRKLVDEHGGFFTNQDLKKERWDEFFKNMGIGVSSKRATSAVEATAEEIAKVEDPGKFEKKKFEAKTFDKPEPEKKLTEKKTKEEYSGVKALEEPGALRAWNKAVDNTNMVDSLNKTFIQERVNPAEGGPKKMSAGTRETLEAYIAENSLKSFEFDPSKTKATTPEGLKKAKERADKAGKSYNEAVQRLEDAKEMARMVEEGTDPFTRTIEVIGEESILGGIDEIKRPFKDGTNAVAESIKMKAEQYGIMDDSAYRYYALSGMVQIKPDGTTGISKKYENAFRKKYGDRIDRAIRKEGKMYTSQKKALLDEAVKKLNDYVSSEWRKSQAFLINQGATDLIDTEKMFESVRGELSQILDDVTKNRNIIQVLDENGEYKFVEVDPLVADLYRSRPYTIRGNESFIRKTSRLARLGNTTFNIKSYLVNQTFKDAIQSVIMAGTAHTIKTYSKEVAEMFGEECIKYLQESMGEAGWDKFAEGLTEKEAREKAADLLITGGLGSKPYAGELTQSKLYQSGNRGPQTSGEDVVSQVRDLTSQGYRQSGWTKNKGLAAGKEAKRGVIGWLEDHSIGNKVNNIRETTLRQANYAAAFNDALRGGQTVAQARATAEFVSRNATTNFQNTFMWGNWICDNVPFLSAAINGSASFWRLFEMDPLGVLTRLNSVGLYVMAQTISSGQTLEDRKTLSNVPDYVKDDNSVFIYGGQVYKIPLPEEVAKFLSPYRQAAEKMLGSENRSWVELLYNDALNISPISLDGFSTEDQTALTKNEGLMSRLSREAQVLISQVTPPVVQTAIMGVTGVDPYTGNEIDTSYVYYDEDGNRQIVNYKAGEAAKALAKVSDKFNWGISADAAEALLEKFLGTGGLNFVDGLMRLGEAFTGADIEGNKISAGEALLKIPEAEATRAASSVTVSEYSIKDKYDRDFKKIIKELTAEKNKMLTPGSKYLDNVNQLSQLKVTDSNYETKKKNLTQSTMQDIEDFRTKAMNLVNTYVAHNGSDYDDKKFASVVALLNFNQQTTMPTTALDFQRAHQDYYDGRQDAYQTMVDLGFSSTNDLSIFGLAKRNKNTGEVYTKYISPVAILNAGATIGSNMAETVNAEIAAALEVSGIDRSDMFEGYYAAKAQGSAAAKQYKKDWNAKVVKAIAPTVYQYGADTILGNSTVQDYLDNYLFISNPYKTEDYLKEIFEVEDK